MYISVKEYPSEKDTSILAHVIEDVKYFRSDISEIVKETGTSVFAYGTVDEIHMKIKMTKITINYGGWLGGI